MQTTHKFAVDLTQAKYSSVFNDGREQILLEVLLQVVNEANKLGLEGERVTNVGINRLPNVGMVIGYELMFQTEKTKTTTFYPQRTLDTGS